jgi:hypothetical protein
MKKTAGLILWIGTLLPVSLQAQECMGVSLKEGSGYEMITYDNKDKENGRMIYRVKDVSKDGATTVVKMDMEAFDKKGKPTMTSTYTLRCNGNEMRVDAAAMLGEEQRRSFESFDMKFTSTDIVYPSNLSVGQTLPDGALHGEGAAGPMNVITDMTMTNRKVVGQETLTVPAGTFDTYKITSDMSVKTKTVMNMGFEFETVSYRANDVLWDVKSETYRKGKLIGKTVLSKVL